MQAPFERFEDLVTQEVFAHLANATATFHDGSQVAGFFEESYEHGDLGTVGFAAARPTFSLPTSAVPARVIQGFLGTEEPVDPSDLRLWVRGTLYQCIAYEPDGQGVSKLVLGRVAE